MAGENFNYNSSMQSNDEYDSDMSSTAAVNDNSDEEKFNPDSEDVDLIVLRGDSIGETTYSASFILRTLIKLENVKGKLSDEYEQQLCQVWDMTTNREVILYLHQTGAVEILYRALVICEDDRLSEIIAGILGNLCAEKVVCANIIKIQEMLDFLVTSICCRDTEVLIQTFRIICCLIIRLQNNVEIDAFHEAIERNGDFYANICEILSNSTNPSLLYEVLRVVNSLTVKYIEYYQSKDEHPEVTDESKVNDSYVNEMINDKVLNSTVEALRAILQKNQNIDIATTCFANIHMNLLPFDSKGVYKHLSKLFDVIHIVICTEPQDDVFGDIRDLLSVVKEVSFWPSIMRKYLETFFKYSRKFERNNEALCFVDEFLIRDVIYATKLFLFKQIEAATPQQLRSAVALFPRNKEYAENFYRFLTTYGEPSPEEGSALDKLKQSYQSFATEDANPID